VESVRYAAASEMVVLEKETGGEWSAWIEEPLLRGTVGFNPNLRVGK